MLLRLSLSLFICLLLFGCGGEPLSKAEKQDQEFLKDHVQLFSEIQAMLVNDQQVRRLQQYGSTDTNYIDSLIKFHANLHLDLDSILMQDDTFLVTKRFSDSVSKLITDQDEKHTARLIVMINKYGYPESIRLDTVTHISPFLLLHHLSLKYKDTLSKLLITELQLKRIDSISYQFILWDLEGREGLPPINGMKSTKNTDGTTTIEL